MPAPANHGASTRRPVVYGGRKIPNLTVRTLDDGTDVYEVRMRMPDGSHPRVKLDATTATDAVRERNGLLVDRDRGVAYENAQLNPTVAELLDEYVADLQRRARLDDDNLRVARSTARGREIVVRHHIKTCQKVARRRVADVTTRDLRDLIAHAQGNGLAPKSVGNVVQTISAALQFACDRDYVQHNVARDLSRHDRPSAKRQTEPRYLTKGELEALLAAAPDHFRPIWTCCAYQAMRIREVLGLQWRCVDLKGNVITICQQAAADGSGEIIPYPKTAASGVTDFDLAPAAARELLAHRSRMAARGLQYVRPEALVFVGERDGRMVDPSVSLRALYRVATELGLNPPGEERIGHHDLRHTAAGYALQIGAQPHEVAERLRHSSPKVTMSTYAGFNTDGRGAAFRKLLDAGFGA